MGSQTTQGIAVEEYLSNPVYEHFEYLDGAVRELHLGNETHSFAQVNCAFLLTLFLRSHPLGTVYTELHCKLPVGARKRFYLPDVCVVLGERRTGRYLEGAPELVVEILSPDDGMPRAIAKKEEWLAAGCLLGWLILPETQALWVFQPGEAHRAFSAADIVDGARVLPGLSFAVGELFQ